LPDAADDDVDGVRLIAEHQTAGRMGRSRVIKYFPVDWLMRRCAQGHPDAVQRRRQPRRC